MPLLSIVFKTYNPLCPLSPLFLCGDFKYDNITNDKGAGST
jgi:hypothetical protein